MITNGNFERQLISMLSAAVSGAAADGTYEAFITSAERKITGALPQTSCIYVYALSAPGAHHPNAVYIGQSVRDAYTRLREHLRRGRTAAEAQLVSLLRAGNTMRILAMPAPEDALNALERTGLCWLMENAYSVRILNTDWAGANHCAFGAGDEARSPYALRPISEFGSAVDSFALSRVADALDDYERSLSSDALSDIDALGAIALSCPDAQYGLQAVSVSADGTARILAGAPMMLAARRTGRMTAFGRVTVVSAERYAGGDVRTTVQALWEAGDLKKALPKTQWKALSNLVTARYARTCAACGATAGRCRTREGVARLLVPDAPRSDSQTRNLMHSKRFGRYADRAPVIPSAPLCA